MVTLEQARQILGLPEQFTLQELKACYRKLAATYHPDVAGTGDAGRFIEINLAYELLREALGRMDSGGESGESSHLEMELEQQIQALARSFEQIRWETIQKLEKKMPQAIEYLAQIVANYPSRKVLQERLMKDAQAWGQSVIEETVRYINRRLSHLYQSYRDLLADYLALREAEWERQRKIAARRPRFVWVSTTVGVASALTAVALGLVWPGALGLGLGVGLVSAALSLIPLYRFTPLPDFAERYRLPMEAFTLPAVSVDLSTGAWISQEGAQRLGAIGGCWLGGMIDDGLVGAIIGGILGSIVGSLFGEPLEQYKQKIWARLAEALDGALDKAFGQIDAEMSNAWARLEEQVRANYQRNRAQCLRLLARDRE